MARVVGPFDHVEDLGSQLVSRLREAACELADQVHQREALLRSLLELDQLLGRDGEEGAVRLEAREVDPTDPLEHHLDGRRLLTLDWTTSAVCRRCGGPTAGGRRSRRRGGRRR
jgi:hypothetical protein